MCVPFTKRVRPRPDVSQPHPLDGRVLGAVFGQFALCQPDLLDLSCPDVRIPVLDDLLDAFFPPGVVHPGDRRVWRELVLFGVETERDGFALDGLVQACQFFAALPDAHPDDADVVEVREDAETADRRPERSDAAVGDGPLERVGHRRHTPRIGVAEELQRDVRLCGIRRPEPARSLEQFLDGRHRRREPVEVDAHEQAHTSSW